MINSYIITNRKTPLLIKTFIFVIILMFIFIIWGLNTLDYQPFIQTHSKIIKENSIYYLEVLSPLNDISQIKKQSKIIINEKSYNYKIYKIDNKIIYKNKQNYQKIYLEILNLDKKYQISNYHLEIKILKEKKKIIDYFKE